MRAIPRWPLTLQYEANVAMTLNRAVSSLPLWPAYPYTREKGSAFYFVSRFSSFKMTSLMMTSMVLMATLTPMTLAAIGALTEEDIAFALTKHNEYRAGEPAATMPDLTWSASLASEAQAWADGCNFAHQTGQSWGENIAARTSGIDTNQDAIDRMVDQWTAESRFNTDGSFSCCSSSDYSCCHLTQVIWAKTTEVGCGLTLCSTLTTSGDPISDAAYLVCYYDPP
ncbi:peptidase inhibitor 16 [Elysia marginata]|uniref:Peptidase inhibitor 16 n=1 Tax=Elysia marginata TaxID=1093978 RepID=A0AAV4IC37_9GAST|nr:peptidase inhibitor 16 [Elysia marginata]